MPKLKVYDLNKAEVGEVKLNDDMFTLPYNEGLIHEVIVAYLANNRQGTKSTLTRSEVRGHAKKPWRQKGTGRARQGSTKGPQWKGGGVVFAPKPRDFSKKVNKKAKAHAFLSALSTKIANGEVYVINNFDLAEGKTKLASDILKKFDCKGRTMFVITGDNENLYRATANIQKLSVAQADLFNTYEIVSNKNVLISLDAIKQLEEAFN